MGTSTWDSQTTVSRKVAQLEANLGVRLLQRTTRKLSLTEVGNLYLTVVAAFETLKKPILLSLPCSRFSGTLRVTATEGFGNMILNDWLIEFYKSTNESTRR